MSWVTLVASATPLIDAAAATRPVAHLEPEILHTTFDAGMCPLDGQVASDSVPSLVP
jgi:hypothetical protein